MHRFLTSLILIAPVAHAAEDAAARSENEKKSVFEGLTKLLPPGSELRGVILPSFDENRRLTGMLKAKAMRLVDADTMSGESISIDFSSDDPTRNGRAALESALFHSKERLIEAWSPVSFDGDSMHARASGLVLDFEKKEGILLGPLETWTPMKTKETAMNSKTNPLLAAGLAGAALVSQAAAEPAAPGNPPVSPPRPAAFDTAKKDLAAALEQSDAANARAKEFLEKNGLSTPDVKVVPEEPAAKPLDIKPGPDDAVVSCDGGMYFSPDEGAFVYLKNVRVTDPRFTMSGANDLKIFLEKASPEELEKKLQEKRDERAAKAKAAGKEVPPDQKVTIDDLDFRDKFGNPEKIVATGAILMEQKPGEAKDPKQAKEPIKASGAIFTYNIKGDEVLISGGFPWVIQGGLKLRAREPNLTLRIHPKVQSFDTEGQWDTMVPIEQLQKENEKKKQEKKDQNH